MKKGSHHSSNNKDVVKVIYSVDGDAHKLEFTVLCHEEALRAWRQDKTRPLVDVVQSYDIFLGDTGGHTGQLLRASQQSLENAFGKGVKEIEILCKILQDGLIEQFHGTRSMKEHGAHVTRGHTLAVR